MARPKHGKFMTEADAEKAGYKAPQEPRKQEAVIATQKMTEAMADHQR